MIFIFDFRVCVNPVSLVICAAASMSMCERNRCAGAADGAPDTAADGALRAPTTRPQGAAVAVPAAPAATVVAAWAPPSTPSLDRLEACITTVAVADKQRDHSRRISRRSMDAWQRAAAHSARSSDHSSAANAAIPDSNGLITLDFVRLEKNEKKKQRFFLASAAKLAQSPPDSQHQYDCKTSALLSI